MTIRRVMVSMALLTAGLAAQPSPLVLVGEGPYSSRPGRCLQYRDVYRCTGSDCSNPYYLCGVSNAWEVFGGTLGNTAATDIVALFTGTPDGTKLLRDDGTLTTAGAGTVTHTNGALPAGALVTGNGSADILTPSPSTTLDSSGNLTTPGTVTTGVGSGGIGKVQLVDTGGVNFIGLSAPGTVTASLSLLFPNANPSDGQVLVYAAPSSNVSNGSWTPLVLPGTGNAFACLDATGALFRSATACN